MKKKIVSMVLALALIALLSGCGQSAQDPDPAPTPEIVTNVAALKGPTGMGMVKLMSDNDEAEEKIYNTTIIAAPDEIPAKLLQKELDVAALPANLAAAIYNKSEGTIRVIGINTLGVLYLAEKGDSVQDVADLRGKTIHLSGKGATPEYALRYVLEEAGLTPEQDVTLSYKSEHTEVIAALAADPNAIGLLPEPFLTVAESKDPDLRMAIDLNQEWEDLSSEDVETALITGVVVARTEFIEEHPEAIARFLEDYKASTDFVLAEPEEAATLIGAYDIVEETVAQKALPRCNITLITGEDMKTKLSNYIDILYAQNPNAVGGELPDEDFYFISAA